MGCGRAREKPPWRKTRECPWEHARCGNLFSQSASARVSAGRESDCLQTRRRVQTGEGMFWRGMERSRERWREKEEGDGEEGAGDKGRSRI